MTRDFDFNNEETLRNRIAELEETLRLIQEGALEKRLLEKSTLGNLYWDIPSTKRAIERPYKGNDRQFLKFFFRHELYGKFIKSHKELQEYWRSPMYCIDRQPDGYRQVCSNIHVGDYFACGSTEYIAMMYGKVTHLQAALDKQYQRPSPAGEGGDYLSYRMGGDIGGHWYEPLHDDFISTKHFKWLPTVDRLRFAGFKEQAVELQSICEEIWS